MSDSRPAVSTPEDIAKWLSEHSRRGGRVTIQDPRVNQFIGWSAVVMGGLLTIAITWGVSSIVELNKQVALLVAKPDPATKEQMEWLSERVRRLEEHQK